MTKENNTSSYFKRTFNSPWPWILTTLALIMFYTLGDIIKLILPLTKYHYVPGFAADIAANKIRPYLVYPLPELFDWKGGSRFLIVPYYLLVSYILFHLHLRVKKYYLKTLGVVVMVLVFLRVFPGILLVFESNKPSISVGKHTNGTMTFGKRMPFSGKNYRLYSFAGYLAGRTYVHYEVKNTIIESFQSIEDKTEGRVFKVGESGFKEGGPISFHKGKQNGMEVDFLLPMNYEDGKPYNKNAILKAWNYKLEFVEGKIDKDLSIDYNHLSAHIAALYRIAPKYGLKVKRIEMHPDVYNGLYGEAVGGIMKSLFRLAGKKQTKNAAAYYTVVFEQNNGKSNLIEKIFNN